MEPGDYELSLEDIPAGLDCAIALPRRVSLTAGKIVDQVFSSAGDYPVTLRVTDESGATDSRTKTVIVE